tara:strand:+ start:136 stop:354 length:219 start_codon:yes stop_codon:yes gene_type:complete
MWHLDVYHTGGSKENYQAFKLKTLYRIYQNYLDTYSESEAKITLVYKPVLKTIDLGIDESLKALENFIKGEK